MSWVCECYSNYRNDLLLVKIAVNVVISIQWIVDYVAGVATFNLIARILGAVFMPLPLQKPAFLSLISMFIYLLIKLGAVIALVKVSTFFFTHIPFRARNQSVNQLIGVNCLRKSLTYFDIKRCHWVNYAQAFLFSHRLCISLHRL